MMRKIWMTIDIYLILLASILCGCSGRDENVYSFKEREDTSALSQDAEVSGVSVAASDAEDFIEESRAVEEIVIYLCGAVATPGVITLPEGSRLNDAVQAAGGFTEEASETSVNLAVILQDEEMVYIPTRAEVENGRAVSGIGTEAADSSESQLININTADINDLCELPGIGESRARDIVAYREKNGAFLRKEDIMKVTGIKESLYGRICDLISVK